MTTGCVDGTGRWNVERFTRVSVWPYREGWTVSDDRLVVGYQEFIRTVAGGLATTDDHSCEQGERPDYKAMAQSLWASGYRFDPDARKQWLVVELRSKTPSEMQSYLNELLRLLGVEL